MLVRPAREGSFIIEAIRVAGENWEGAATVASVGIPSIASITVWSTKSVRADVADFATSRTAMSRSPGRTIRSTRSRKLFGTS